MQLHNETKMTAEAMIAPDGSLVLLSPVILPFKPGQCLRLQITTIEEQSAETMHRRGAPVVRYEELCGATPTANR